MSLIADAGIPLNDGKRKRTSSSSSDSSFASHVKIPIEALQKFVSSQNDEDSKEEFDSFVTM